ncbi:MAG TPA: polymer-forming cytoskeletal protein [Paludibacteraceae bacterium]|nr:polymer-forming cytoskeletal protein [Paludibacteraceae bacterium]HOV83527.1 polymer-forming cytoskeletal protein [Paludibacteraceae bacterium]
MAKEVVQNSGIIYNSLTNGSKIVGKIIADSDFRIDGEVEGEIACKGKLIIGQKGFLKGSITCNNTEILGRVEGNLLVFDTLTLRETAIVNADVRTKVLVVEPNAIFNGSCSMQNNLEKESEENLKEIKKPEYQSTNV